MELDFPHQGHIKSESRNALTGIETIPPCPTCQKLVLSESRNALTGIETLDQRAGN